MYTLEIIPLKDKITESLQLAAEYNAGFEYNDFFVPTVLDQPGQIEELIEFYKSLPRDRSRDTLHGAFLDIAIHSSDSLIRNVSEKRMRQSMEIADRLHIRGVIFHTNLLATFQEKNYLQNWLKCNRNFFLKLSSEFPHLHIYMENMFDLYPQSYAAFGEAMSDCPNVSLCLDVAHAHLSGVPVSEWIDASFPYIGHIHINDNDGRDDNHDTIGCGTIDWQQYDRLIRRYQIQASVLVETGSVEKQRQSLVYMKKNHLYPFS